MNRKQKVENRGQKTWIRKIPSFFLFFLSFFFSLIPDPQPLTPVFSVAQEKRTVADSLKREVTFSFPPKRIVSTAPNITEMLFVLNLDEQIVGVTDYCNFPAKAKTKPKVGGYYNPSVEKIISLKPDLLVTTADGYNKPIIDKLTSSGVPCFVFNSQSIAQIFKDILTLGDLTDRQEKAIEYVEKLQERVSKVTKKVKLIPQNKRLKVFYGLSSDPLWTAGPNTFIHDLINQAGGINVAADANGTWVKYSLEKLIANKPDAIITGEVESQKNEDAIAPWLKYTSLPAVANGRIYAINVDWLSRPGPRLIDALEAVYALLYEQRR